MKHNGRSDFRCPACSVRLGFIRTTPHGRTFTPDHVSGARYKYLTGGRMTIVCRCTRVVSLRW